MYTLKYHNFSGYEIGPWKASIKIKPSYDEIKNIILHYV